ncbi:hypothetical protein, partial [Escherichia coli]|uniref:hypothetical protein n=1 Tax=Escherichia coli TaxID=562 RepID=UPI001F4B25DC
MQTGQQRNPKTILCHKAGNISRASKIVSDDPHDDSHEISPSYQTTLINIIQEQHSHSNDNYHKKNMKKKINKLIKLIDYIG